MEQCINCHAGCCRAMNIELTGYDILRLYKNLDISPFFFITAIPVEGEKLKKNRDKMPLFKFTDLKEGIYHKLIMQSELSELFMFTNKCIFLQEWEAKELGSKKLNGIIGRCGIYHCRPLTCRTFPTKFNDDSKPCVQDPYAIVKNKQKTEEFWKKPSYQLCPNPVETKDYIHFSNQYFKDLYEQQYETEYFLKVSEKWNENPDVSDNFIEFLEKEYENRLLPPQES